MQKMVAQGGECKKRGGNEYKEIIYISQTTKLKKLKTFVEPGLLARAVNSSDTPKQTKERKTIS